MQSTILDVLLSSKEMWQHYRKRHVESIRIQWINLSISGFKQCYKDCIKSSLQTSQRYQQQQKISKDIKCICMEKLTVYHILFNCQLMKFCLPREWSYDGHVHLSSQNLLLENNLSVLSLIYHLINSLMGHLLCITFVISFFLFLVT